jgi:hypothetical protein
LLWDVDEPQILRIAPPYRSDARCRNYRALTKSMIRKSGNRFSEKIMLQQKDEIMIRFNLIGS